MVLLHAFFLLLLLKIIAFRADVDKDMLLVFSFPVLPRKRRLHSWMHSKILNASSDVDMGFSVQWHKITLEFTENSPKTTLL